MIRAGLVALVLLGVAACGAEEDGRNGVDDGDAEARLEQQREDVRAATADLQRLGAGLLSGTVTGSSGQWRGCESAWLEEYKNFRYEAHARIDVSPEARRPYLDLLGAALDEAGFAGTEPGERPGGRTLRATKGEVSATFSELPAQGDYVLLAVAGPCIDVPEDERHDWLVREEATPEIR